MGNQNTYSVYETRLGQCNAISRRSSVRPCHDISQTNLKAEISNAVRPNINILILIIYNYYKRTGRLAPTAWTVEQSVSKASLHYCLVNEL